ncbi:MULTISPECIES: nuclear transport factor 2 family protein [unclassified Frankia]|uniref:nuclear transport factor 2 family protein n=1 Tax=unclassified Frankia TaxID=2632575 RepID=UPI002AD44972|nr:MULTISPECIES: nuclear transport factor 2 family protein [unclassified Frankia]
MGSDVTGSDVVGIDAVGIDAMGIGTADRLALHEIAARYGDLIDARDWPGLAYVFAADAVFDLTDVDAPRLDGLDAIRHHMDGADHPLAHHITNIYVTEDGGEPVLHSRVLGVLPDRRASSGQYTDAVVRTPDGWRIRHRLFQLNRRPARSPSSATAIGGSRG